MPTQPIPQRIKETKPEMALKKFNTLLIDASNLLEVCFAANKSLNSNGEEIGAVFSFLLQIKLLLRKGNFRYIYAFFDGNQSGVMRASLNPDYKANRDKTYDEEDLSDYAKALNAQIRYMQSKIYKKRNSKTEDEKASFFRQREILIQCLDELFIRVMESDGTEADDFIGYYVSHKKPEERIVIVSNDRDLTQLISEDVIIYVQSMKDFVNTKNHKEKMGYDYHNVLLKKVICGDTSDNIKGIKGVGETTLLNNFPEIKDREVTLDEVIEKAKLINEERISEKKKPLKWAENIVNKVTDGCQGEQIYEINEKIINLKNPLMPEEAKELLESFMYAPLDPEGRSFENLYKILCDAGVDELKDERHFGNFFSEFNYLIDSEMKEWKKSLENTDEK